MKIKSILTMFICILILFCNAMDRQTKQPEQLIQNLDKLIIHEYSDKKIDQLKEFFESLSNSNKDSLLSYLIKNCQINSNIDNCINIIILFTLNEDKYAFNQMDFLYSLEVDEDILAGIELYYSNIGYKPKENLEKYFHRLLNIKNIDSNLLFLAVLCDPQSGVLPILLYIYKTRDLDGSGAELWFSVLSWVEKDRRWLGKDRRLLAEEKMKKYHTDINQLNQN